MRAIAFASGHFTNREAGADNGEETSLLVRHNDTPRYNSLDERYGHDHPQDA